MTRAFIAVRPPDDVLDAVARVVPPVGRPTTRPQWHVTLQFLGNSADVASVSTALEGLTVTRGQVQLGGLGAFPSARRARVVWLGVADGAALFEALASEVGARLAPLGHEPEARRFHAHLTLARLRAPADVRTELGNADATAVGAPWTVREVVVYESRLRRTGAEYLPRTILPLPDPST